VHAVLNRHEALQVPLAQASPDMQLVNSLEPMWQQERWRLGGSSIPPPPASPPRRPGPLCPAVEAVREEFRVRGPHATIPLCGWWCDRAACQAMLHCTSHTAVANLAHQLDHMGSADVCSGMCAR
jgi:hypothetical protein